MRQDGEGFEVVGTCVLWCDVVDVFRVSEINKRGGNLYGESGLIRRGVRLYCQGKV